MKLHSFQQCRLGYTGLSLRLSVILLLLFCISLTSRSQFTDSLIHVRTNVSSEYSDIIRQRSDHSSTTIYTRSFDAKISASLGQDTLALAYSGWNQYASYNNYASEIALSANNGLRSLSLQWISSFDWLDYSAKVLFPFYYKVIPPYYSAWIRIAPFDQIFIPAFSYERLPGSFSSGLGLKDFSFPLDEHSVSSTWNINLQSRPIEFLEGSFSLGRNITTTMSEAVGYSSPLDWKTQTLSAQLKIYPDEKSSIWIGWKRRAENGELHITKNGLPFGDLAYGSYIFNNWQVGASYTVFSFPISSEYNFYRWVLYGVGHIESWPFTSLASTVFDNRFYYMINGIIDVHQIESSTTIAWGEWNIKPSLSLLYILPDLSWRQWEPDFLVFCIRNANEEPFEIQQCWLLRLGCQVDFSVLGLNIAMQMEQYVPISSKEREKKASSTSGLSTPVVSGTHSSTDGGRRIRLEIIIP